MNSEFKIVQSNYTGYAVDKILNKNEIEELAQICSKEGNEILSDCKKCANEKTIEVVFEDRDSFDGHSRICLSSILSGWQLENVCSDYENSKSSMKISNNEQTPNLKGTPFLKMICGCGSDNVSLMNRENIDTEDFENMSLTEFREFVNPDEDGLGDVLGSCYDCQDESLLMIVMKDGTVFDGDESKACEYAINNWDRLIRENTKNVVLLNKVSYNCSCRDNDRKCGDTISLNTLGGVVEFRNNDLRLYGDFNGKHFGCMDNNDLSTLISLAETTPGNISFKCDSCSKIVTNISFGFDDGTTLDNFDGLKYLAKTKNVVMTSTPSNNTRTTMTDYEREVEKLKKWINSLKPKTVKAGRKAAQISIEDFQKKLNEAVPEDERDEEIEDCFWPDVISSLKFAKPSLQKDLSKVQFDMENCDVDFDIHNGVAFASCRAGGDWEMPLRFFVYFDGKDIRGYIPTEGNFFNKLCNIAFGSEGGEGGEPADPNLPIMKKIEEMKNNCKDGSYPNWSDLCSTTEQSMLRLAGVYHLTKKEDLDWNEDPDQIYNDHFFEPGGQDEFFARLGI